MIAAQSMLKGSYRAAGLLIGGSGVAEATIGTRILELWEPGVSVYRIGASALVLFAKPRRVRTEHALGAVVIEIAGRYTTLTLDETSLADSPADHLIHSEAGKVCWYPLSTMYEIAPSAWVEVDDCVVLECEPLGRVKASTEQALSVPNDTREALGKAIPPLAPEAIAMRRSLRGVEEPGAPKGLPPAPSMLARVRGLFSSLVSGVSGWLGASAGERKRVREGGGAPNSARTRAPGVRSESAPLAPRGPSWFDTLSARLRGWAASTVLRSRLGRMLERRQAEYFARVMELFDRGDFEEALRWAIPLGEGDSQGDRPPSLGVPSRRQSLSISMQQSSPRSSVGLGGAFDVMKEYYRKALQTLIDRGDIDHAAYLLAELLGDAAGAVSLLEEHGRFAEAARLAEARKLATALAVRLWLLAGDIDRAMLLARRDNVFAESLALLRKKHPQEAMTLALRWADSLASSGHYEAAVRAVLEFPDAAPLLKEWLRLGSRLRGPSGVRLLPLRCLHDPESWPEVRELALELLHEESKERTAERVELAHALQQYGARTPTLSLLAAETLRATLRDLGMGWSSDQKLIKPLQVIAKSPLLRTEQPTLPPITKPQLLRTRTDCLVHRIAHSDRGALPISAIAPLPNGQMVLATGDSGVHLVGATGKRLQHFDVPANDFVVSDQGYRLLAIGTMGGLKRITRLELESRRSQLWCHRESLSYARTFDGERWLIRDGEHGCDVHLIDATGSEWRSLWSLTGEPMRAVERHGGSLWLMAHLRSTGSEDNRMSQWRYAEQGMRLTSRDAVGPWPGSYAVRCMAVGAHSWVGCEQVAGEAPLGAVFRLAPSREQVGEISASEAVPEGPWIPMRIAASANFLIVASEKRPSAVGERPEVRVRILSIQPLVARMQIALEGSRSVDLRVFDSTLWIADDQGRFLRVDLQFGTIERDLRLQP